MHQLDGLDKRGRLRPQPGRQTIYATQGGDGQGDSPEARGATGQMMAALRDFRA